MPDSYTFPAVVKKHGLSTKKMKDEGGEPYESPCVTITLEFVDEKAREINARLSKFQGEEVTLELSGNGRQLNL